MTKPLPRKYCSEKEWTGKAWVDLDDAPPKNWRPNCYNSCHGNPFLDLGGCKKCPFRNDGQKGQES